MKCGAKVITKSLYDRSGHARTRTKPCGEPAVIIDQAYSLPLCGEHRDLAIDPKPI